MRAVRLRPMTMAELVDVLPADVDAELRGREVTAHHAFTGDLDAVKPEGRDRIPHRIERHAEIEERTDGHVAAHAGERVEVRDAHARCLGEEDCTPRGAMVSREDSRTDSRRQHEAARP